MSTPQEAPPGRTATSDLLRLAVAYNDALDRCTQTDGANVDEVMAFFADEAVRVDVGLTPQPQVSVGAAAIREGFLRRREQRQVVELKGVDLWGDQVICRLERRDASFTHPGVTHNLRVLLVKGGKIVHLTVVVDPDEPARLRGAPGPVCEAPVRLP
jgi:hypothetical protein